MQNPPPPLHPGLGPAASAPFVENLLPACNGQLDLRAAYTWNRDQIFNFLAAVIVSPAQHGADPTDAPELTLILQEIRNLSLPNGHGFNAPNLQPNQHISRSLNPAWVANPQAQARLSKFRLSKLFHWGIPYWSPADLLGLFLAKTGPAPPAATKRSFFLLLTAMYGKWVHQIIGTRAYMYNCTWYTAANGQTQFFLGASLTGHNGLPHLVGKWKKVLQRARYRLVAGEFMSLRGWSFNDTPARVQDSVSTKFGNCAETYPFVHFLRGHSDMNRNVHGIALQWKGTRPATYQDSLRGETWKRVADPCFNCQELIDIHGGRVANFDRYSGSIGGPP